MAKKNEKKEKKERKQPDTRPIPKFYSSGFDREGKPILEKLKKAAFPKTKEGALAFCDYMIAKWGVKKEAISKKRAIDPRSKLLRKKEKMQAKLEQVSKELAELEGQS